MTPKRPTSPVPLDPHEVKIEREAAEADASAATTKAIRSPAKGERKEQPAGARVSSGAGTEMAAIPREPNRVVATWAGGMQFDAGRPGGLTLRLDGTGESGQSPVDAVLSALAGCTGIDVVEILAKRKTPVRRMEIEVLGDRVNTVPRRLTKIHLEFRIDGDGIERDQAERAIALSIDRYCSVRDSLAKDIAIEWRLALHGEPGTVKQSRAGETPA